MTYDVRYTWNFVYSLHDILCWLEDNNIKVEIVHTGWVDKIVNFTSDIKFQNKEDAVLFILKFGGTYKNHEVLLHI